MLIKNYIYCISIILSLLSIIYLIWSIKNKNKYICNWIIIVNTTYILYLIINLFIRDILYIPVGFEVLIMYLIEFISGILCISSIVINLIKKQKLRHTQKSTNVMLMAIFSVLLPAILLSASIIRNKILINNSDLILVYESNGNGKFDNKTFAYAVGENFCEQFDLGIEIGGHNLEKFLPANAVEINNPKDIDYEIVFNESWEDNSISVYKNNEKICKTKNESHYFNIDFEKGFYLKH